MSRTLEFLPPKTWGPFRTAHGYNASMMQSKPAERLGWALLPTGKTETAKLLLSRALDINPQRVFPRGK